MTKGAEETQFSSSPAQRRAVYVSPSMKITIAVLAFAALSFQSIGANRPLAQHPDDPHYFLFRGKPTVLITSGEHYGAVLNLDFDFAKYLDTLAADGLNLTRTFSGAYVEPAGAFNIAQNTLAPGAERFLAPWARSDQPGYPNGGNKFDLTRWNDAYFTRLRAFVSHASKRGIVVELNLFCPFYEESQWRLSPQNAANNINGIGAIARTNVYTLDHSGGLLAIHEAMTRKFVAAMRDFDNVYFEICNEPYFGGVTLEWQRHIADVITDAERPLKRRHLISQNIANGSEKVADPHSAVSILNFHYANPPDAVGQNFALGRVIGDNETGFRGTNDFPYRTEAWAFLHAGGGLFNHLDYSFVAGREDGTFVYPANQPGGGNPALRKQFAQLARWMQGMPFVRMHPAPDLICGKLPEGTRGWALAEPGKRAAVYIARTKPATSANSHSMDLELPAGTWQVEWTLPLTCRVDTPLKVRHAGGVLSLTVPSYAEDLAVRLTRVGR